MTRPSGAAFQALVAHLAVARNLFPSVKGISRLDMKRILRALESLCCRDC